MTSATTSIPLRLKAGLALALALLMLAATTFMPGSMRGSSPLLAQTNEDAAIAETTSQGQGNITTAVYVVRRGDTLGTIARRHNSTIAVLLRLNPQIRNPNRIYVGQRIRVPVRAEVPNEEPTGFTLTRIYLVSQSDGGTLGCGDTLVPVTVEIPATRAILRASLDQLLSLKSPYYGESGLYNALYQSHLTLDDVRIDNRVAIIRLSGQVVLGGVCDTPRVQAQLEQIALQFSTVDQVEIYINGNRLQDVLN